MASEKFVVKGARLSYLNAFEPKTPKGSDKAKYSVSILIPKEDEEQIGKLQKLIEKVAVEKFGEAAKKLGKKLNNPLRDGDDEREDDPVYKGHMFINASSTRKPQVVDRKVHPIMDESEAYSGCYGKVSIALFGFDVDMNAGVAAGLNNIQITKLGERLGGAADASSDFEELEDDEDDDIQMD